MSRLERARRTERLALWVCGTSTVAALLFALAAALLFVLALG